MPLQFFYSGDSPLFLRGRILGKKQENEIRFRGDQAFATMGKKGSRSRCTSLASTTYQDKIMIDTIHGKEMCGHLVWLLWPLLVESLFHDDRDTLSTINIHEIMVLYAIMWASTWFLLLYTSRCYVGDVFSPPKYCLDVQKNPPINLLIVRSISGAFVIIGMMRFIVQWMKELIIADIKVQYKKGFRVVQAISTLFHTSMLIYYVVCGHAKELFCALIFNLNVNDRNVNRPKLDQPLPVDINPRLAELKTVDQLLNDRRLTQVLGQIVNSSPARNNKRKKKMRA